MLSHYWTPEGTGEASSRFLNPACDRAVRRHVDDFPAGTGTALPPPRTSCPNCIAITSAVSA